MTGRAAFTAGHAYELRRHFDPPAGLASGGLSSWLGPMLERAHGMSLPEGTARGPWTPPDQMRVRETAAYRGGKEPRGVGFGIFDVAERRAVPDALSALPPRLSRVLAAHYGPEPPGAAGLEPKELRAVLCLVAKKSPEELKTVQARALAVAGRPPCSVALGALAVWRLAAERALASAEQAYAALRGPVGA